MPIVRRDCALISKVKTDAPAPGKCPDCGAAGETGKPCATCGTMVAAVPAAAPAPEAPAPEAAPAEPKAASDSRVRLFVASSEAVDSYNTTIKAAGWDLSRFSRNPIVPLFHRYDAFPVARGVASIEGNQLMIAVELAPADDPVVGPAAEQALRWIDRGVMGVSVGFKSLEETYNAERESGDPITDLFYPPIDYTRTELLEVSIVSIPANPDALQVGRASQVEAVRGFAGRQLERMSTRAAPPPPAPSKVDELDVALIARLVREITAEEVRAARLRRAGNTK
jgi:hypothetical protein